MTSQPVEPVKRAITSHLIELRKKLIWVFIAMALGTAISFVFKEYIYGFLVQPLATIMPEGRLITTGLTEGFFTYLKVSFFAGIFITFPILLSQIWTFIAPGLYKEEKKSVLTFFDCHTNFIFFCWWRDGLLRRYPDGLGIFLELPKHWCRDSICQLN